jgi:hypothetical protein
VVAAGTPAAFVGLAAADAAWRWPVRKNVSLIDDSSGFRAQCWIAFVLSLGATTFGIYLLDAGAWERAFLGLGLWFTVSATVTLSKAMRDAHEAQKLSSQVNEVKTERILREMARDDLAA